MITLSSILVLLQLVSSLLVSTVTNSNATLEMKQAALQSATAAVQIAQSYLNSQIVNTEPIVSQPSPVVVNNPPVVVQSPVAITTEPVVPVKENIFLNNVVPQYYSIYEKSGCAFVSKIGGDGISRPEVYCTFVGQNFVDANLSGSIVGIPRFKPDGTGSNYGYKKEIQLLYGLKIPHVFITFYSMQPDVDYTIEIKASSDKWTGTYTIHK